MNALSTFAELSHVFSDLEQNLSELLIGNDQSLGFGELHAFPKAFHGQGERRLSAPEAPPASHDILQQNASPSINAAVADAAGSRSHHRFFGAIQAQGAAL